MRMHQPLKRVAVVTACSPWHAAGNPQSNRCDSENELRRRLDKDGVTLMPRTLPTAFLRLEDGRYRQLFRLPRPASEANDSTGLSPSTGDRCHAEIEMSTVGGCASE